MWINANDWRRAAAIVREQNIRHAERKGSRSGGHKKGPDAKFKKNS